MIICRVVGSAVSTIKHEGLTGYKLLLCQELQGDTPAGAPFIAVDTVGSGEGALVAVIRGKAAQSALHNPAAPTDAAVVAILDSYSMGGRLFSGKDEPGVAG